MCPSFSLCACRILKIKSCLRRPLAPGSSRERAMRVSSVMFFSFSSAMVMITYGSNLQREVKGNFEKSRFEILTKDPKSWGKTPRRARGGRLLKQPAAAARTLLLLNPLPDQGRWPCPHGSGRRSSSLVRGCWACETYGWPWKQPGTEGNGSVPCREHHKSNQSA